jgi:hypothetical protein
MVIVVAPIAIRPNSSGRWRAVLRSPRGRVCQLPSITRALNHVGIGFDEVGDELRQTIQLFFAER